MVHAGDNIRRFTKRDKTSFFYTGLHRQPEAIMFAFTKKERIIFLTLTVCLILGLGISSYQRYDDAQRLIGLEKTYAARDAAYRTLAAEPEGKTAADSLKLNVNTATAKELEQLPRIGPVLSGRIVTYREENGPFKKIDDLTNIKGIGEKTLERIRPFIYIE